MAWLHAVYFTSPSKGWAVGSKGTLLATEDRGRTWVVRRAPTEDTLRDIYFTDEQTGWLVCDRNIFLLRTKEEPRSYLLKTTDGGQTWSRVEVTGADTDVLLTRIVFAGAERGWAFGEMGALYATTDGGASWARQSVPTKHLLLGGALLADGQGWLVGAGRTILQTPDGGFQWRPGQTPASASATRLNAVAFVDERTGWAVGEHGLVLQTVNGGRTWRAQESNVSADLLDVKFLNAMQGWAVGARGTAIHTADGGANWQVERSDTRHPLERLSAFSFENVRAVGFGGTIVSRIDDNAPSPLPPQLKTPDTAQPKERPRRATKSGATNH